jgi:hypothetical protein
MSFPPQGSQPFISSMNQIASGIKDAASGLPTLDASGLLKPAELPPGTVVLINADETAGTDVNNTNNETVSKSYSLAANSYSYIQIESEIKVESGGLLYETDINFYIGTSEMTFPFRSTSTYIFMTLKFLAVQKSAATIKVTVTPTYVDPNYGGQALSLRVYGVI